MKRINGSIVASFIIFAGIACGCSQDDADYDSNMYTLAEEMGTRMVEPPPVNNINISDTIQETYDITLLRHEGTKVFIAVR